MDENEKSLGALIREQEDNFIRGNTQISKYVNFSMHDTLEKIEAYANSKHVSGEWDSQGREKPFFNIVTAAMNIWYRATDIDRKNVKFTPTENSAVPLALVANIILQNWMNDNRFGQFLNDWGRSLSKYGSTVLKFVENKDGLTPSVIPWNRLIVDSVDFEANPKIEILELTEAQLKRRVKTHGYNQVAVKALCNALKARETIDKRKKDNKNDYIKLYELHGELEDYYEKAANDKPTTDADMDNYSQQMHVISFVGTKVGRKTEYEDFTLFAGLEEKDPYMITHLIKEDSRSLSVGAIEHLFQAQWMANHSVKSIKDTLDITSRAVFQTADTHFVGRNVLSDFESGDIFVHGVNMPLEKVESSNIDTSKWQNFMTNWQNLAQEITATPDALRGNNTPSNQPYSTTALLAGSANSLFELMTENKGLHIEDMMNLFIIPYVKKQLKNTDQIVAILDDAGIAEIDTMYIPSEAIKRYNARTTAAVLNNARATLSGGTLSPIQPFNQQQEQQKIQQQNAPSANNRFFVPDDVDDSMTWDEVFSDFEWTSIRCDVTNEQVDKQAMLGVLNTVMQTIASNPLILQNQNAMQIFSAILRETGAISPIQLSSANVISPLPPTTLQMRDTVDFKDLPPDAQQQLLTRQGIQIQPQQQPAGSSGGGVNTP